MGAGWSRLVARARSKNFCSEVTCGYRRRNTKNEHSVAVEKERKDMRDVRLTLSSSASPKSFCYSSVSENGGCFY